MSHTVKYRGYTITRHRSKAPHGTYYYTVTRNRCEVHSCTDFEAAKRWVEANA